MSTQDSWSVSGRVPAIKAVMTAFPYSLDVEATVADARSLMAANEFSHLPIQEAHLPVGMVSERELDSSEPHTPLGEVMHTEIFIVDMNQPLDQVLLYMAENHVASALVVHEGRLAGIFTATDACHLLGKKLAQLAGRVGSDGIA